jgi:hypothetical protein
VNEIRGLTIRPPWSWAIAFAGKTVENRTWATRYRGLIAIHAGLRPEREAIAHPLILAALERLDGPQFRWDCGLIIAVAELTDCHWWHGTCKPNGELRLTCSPWAVMRPGTWHWTLTEIRVLPEPVRCKGAQGLWRLPEETDLAVRVQLATLAARDDKEDSSHD